MIFLEKRKKKSSVRSLIVTELAL